MEFTPRSEREIRDSMVLPIGEYDFEVAKASDAISKTSGNPMIALELRVFTNDSSPPRIVKDYLLPALELKLNRFCHCVGIEDEYYAGNVTAYSCESRTGKVKLGIETSAQYGTKNTVKDYLVPTVEDSFDDEAQNKPPEPVGVPAAQTKKAKKAQKEREADAGYSDEAEIPF